MSHTVPAGARSRSVSVAILRVARGLLALLGLSLVLASGYFAFFASPEDGGVVNPVDWVVAAWALATGVGMIVAAARRGPTGVRLGYWMLASHVAFGLVKLVGYGETESIGLFVVDFVVAGLLLAGSRQRR